MILTSSIGDQDPAGDISSLLTSAALAVAPRWYTGLDGSRHLPPDLLDRIEADLLPAAAWAGEVAA